MCMRAIASSFLLAMTRWGGLKSVTKSNYPSRKFPAGPGFCPLMGGNKLCHCEKRPCAATKQSQAGRYGGRHSWPCITCDCFVVPPRNDKAGRTKEPYTKSNYSPVNFPQVQVAVPLMQYIPDPYHRSRAGHPLGAVGGVPGKLVRNL